MMIALCCETQLLALSMSLSLLDDPGLAVAEGEVEEEAVVVGRETPRLAAQSCKLCP